MAHYFLSDQRDDITGLHHRDQNPLHRWCDTPLKILGDDLESGHPSAATRWTCTECRSSGQLVHAPTALTRRVARRALSSPDMPPPPTNPGGWQSYLDQYFAGGVLQVGIENDGVTVRDNGAWVVADGVLVRQNWGREGTVLELHNLLDHGRGAFLPDVLALHQVAPGYLMVEGTRGRWARLDTHLASWEQALIQSHRDEDQ